MIRFPLPARHLALLVLSVCCSTGFALSARAQPKIELQTCEDLKVTKKQYGALVVETATCVGPTKTFRPKGTLRNVHLVATFPAYEIPSCPRGQPLAILRSHRRPGGAVAGSSADCVNGYSGQ